MNYWINIMIGIGVDWGMSNDTKETNLKNLDWCLCGTNDNIPENWCYVYSEPPHQSPPIEFGESSSPYQPYKQIKSWLY